MDREEIKATEAPASKQNSLLNFLEKLSPWELYIIVFLAISLCVLIVLNLV